MTTNRNLDFALQGHGFFAISTPAGTRYTRNGSFSRTAEGTLITADGMEVQGADGKPIQLTNQGGEISIESDGTIRAGDQIARQLKVVDFDDYSTLTREDNGRLKSGIASRAASPNTQVLGGTLEQSNVSIVERMAHLTEVNRSFEALQRGVSVLMNDIDSRAISELGRR
jgi:flagellar basal-body rod protein FlgG